MGVSGVMFITSFLHSSFGFPLSPRASYFQAMLWLGSRHCAAPASQRQPGSALSLSQTPDPSVMGTDASPGWWQGADLGRDVPVSASDKRIQATTLKQQRTGAHAKCAAFR